MQQLFSTILLTLFLAYGILPPMAQFDLFESVKEKEDGQSWVDPVSGRPPLQRTRADQILDAFELFHQANPEVWRLYKRFALDAIASGRKNYSSDCVCHRIRWHTAIETRGDDLKINDHFTAYYARLFHLAYPQHNTFFRNRRLTSENEPSYGNDMQVFNAGPPGDEEVIIERLLKVLRNTPLK